MRAKVPGGSVDALYNTLERLVDQSLRRSASTLVGDPGIWTPAHADELARRITTEPEGSSGLSFDDKLLLQLGDAERGVVLLAADLRFLHVLPVYDMGEDLKARRVAALLDLVGESFPDELRDALAPGIVAWGSGHAQAWPQFRLLVRFAAWISELGEEERAQVLDDPWNFKERLFELDATSAQMEREALLHLVYPDTFDAVFSQWHKEKIVDRWAEHAEGESDRDRALLSIRAALADEFGETLHWYEPHIRDLWDPSEPPIVEAGAGRTQVEPGRDDPDPLGSVASDLHLPTEWVRRVDKLLRDKGQLVLYGPPGTGKTFVAQRLAEAIAPDPARRRLVQFHPSTSYEDFFEGYRPRVDDAGQMIYRLVKGPLARIAEAAASEPASDFVLIVDEINRANLPRVLGELLFLLEYRDEAITTLYRVDEPFALPENLFLIGTMNTADRSIALIDAAMRRRFHFVPMFPDAPPIEGLLDRWTRATDADRRWPKLLAMVNEWLREDLGGSDLQVGPSHFLAEGMDEEGARLAWDHSIFPYIEDQLFDRPTELSKYSWSRVMAALDGTDASGDELPAGGDVDDIPAEPTP